MKRKIFIACLLGMLVLGFFYQDLVIRCYNGFQGYLKSKKFLRYYVLNDNYSIQDITEALIADPSVPAMLKKPLIDKERRILVFKYPSDGEEVAGYLSYLPEGDHHTLLFLRGGNGNFGIMRPNNPFSFIKDHHVIGTLYRGNLYGGNDEFGGRDIHDIQSLIEFMPQLEKFTHQSLQKPSAILGVSRGAMQMFIALSQLTELQSTVKKAISVSGNLDLTVNMNHRPEIKSFFKKMSDQNHTSSFANWINARNPITLAHFLPTSLQVLLIYGLSDNRVFLEEQLNFKRVLQNLEIQTELNLIPNISHDMSQHFSEIESMVTQFLNERTE